MSKTSSNTKNHRIILRNRSRNKRYKLAIKRAVKKYLLVLLDSKFQYDSDAKNFKICSDNLSVVYQRIDKAVKKRVLHKNTAARRKRRLAKMLK
uniref:Ribosomal protein S20 n=1 Tax=Palisada sp. TaxID=1955416 RepID=A0A1Z1MRI9_9FLOR|nr:ribosomal protein S20 [Palisada sp.]